MQSRKRVVLWNLEDLLGGVVEFFLNSREGWEVINISERKSIDVFIEEVKKQRAETVILCKDENKEDTELLLQLLMGCPDVKFVTIHRESNSVEIFRKRKIWLKDISDFAIAMDS